MTDETDLPEQEDETVLDTTEETSETVEAKKPEEKFVPLPALHEERQKRKELQRKIEDMQHQQIERDTLLERRLAALQERNTPKEPEPPAFEEDPATHLKMRQDRQDRELAEVRQFREQQQHLFAAQNQAQQFQMAVAEQEHQFRATAPDYDEAIAHVRAVRTRELEAIGLDPQSVQQQLAQDAMFIAQQSMSRGKNPAQAVYEIAQSFGFGKKDDTIDRLTKGQQAAKSLSGGGRVDKGLTLKDLAEMSEEDFAKLTPVEIDRVMKS